jgi:glycosyltransferase involved in cell wall biosynthesis
VSDTSVPAVTWLMPVRNGMPYLPETLASLAAQRYPNQRILAWDNGSTDGTVQELRRWVPHRIPGRVVTDQPLPLGQCRARMVEMADTELLAPMDADDIAAPDRLAVHVRYMQAHPDVALISGAVQKVDIAGRPLEPVPQIPTDDAELRWLLRFACPIAQGAAMFRRSAVLAVGNYHDICPGQDFNLWVRLAHRYRLGNTPQLALLYRQHGESVSHQQPEKRAELDRLGRARVADLLYPGFAAADYERLYHLVRNGRSLDVTRRDIVGLRRLAVAAARASGLPDRAFTATAVYRKQRRNLMTRWLKTRPVIATAWPAIRQVGRWSRQAGMLPAA